MVTGKDEDGVQIDGKRVFLTPITYEDIDDIVRWRNQDTVRKFFICRELFTRESQQDWLEHVVMAGKAVQFIIWEKQTETKIGSVYFRNIDQKNRKCEFGIFIGEETKTGIGYGKEAALLGADYAFCKMGVQKIYLRVLSGNVRAYHSYLGAGFQEEGIFRQDVWIDGEAYDVIYMAKFA